MILYPAIDIRAGHAVRLVQGDYDRETVFDADPVDAARRWADGGAQYLHIVDLDGAREGAPVNLAAIERITSAVDCPVQAGGGLRNAVGVSDLFEAGAQRVVIGTAALRDPQFLTEMLALHGEKVVVSIDARGGNVSLAGWREASGVEVTEAAGDLGRRGVSRFLFTPIEVDGTLEGPGTAQANEVAAATEAELIYSGGIGTIDHLRELSTTAAPNVSGVIVGRALYEGRFSVPEALEALS